MLFDTLRECDAGISELILSSNGSNDELMMRLMWMKACNDSLINDSCMKQLGEYVKSNKNLNTLSLTCTQLFIS